MLNVWHLLFLDRIHLYIIGIGCLLDIRNNHLYKIRIIHKMYLKVIDSNVSCIFHIQLKKYIVNNPSDIIYIYCLLHQDSNHFDILYMCCLMNNRNNLALMNCTIYTYLGLLNCLNMHHHCISYMILYCIINKRYQFHCNLYIFVVVYWLNKIHSYTINSLLHCNEGNFCYIFMCNGNICCLNCQDNIRKNMMCNMQCHYIMNNSEDIYCNFLL